VQYIQCVQLIRFFGRRSFIGLASSAGLGLAALTSPPKAYSGSGNAECISLLDPRVQRFVAFRNKAFTDPKTALNEFALTDVVYTSTSGQNFNAGQLVERIKSWNEAFRRVSVQPVLAAQMDSHSFLIVFDQRLSQFSEFRGVGSSGALFDIRSLFLVSYAADGSIASY